MKAADSRNRRPVVLSAGIRAVGVDTIAAEIGISKRTLYNHFPSKDALIAAYLARRFTQAPPSDKPPVEQILGTFDRLERRLRQQGLSRLPVRQRGGRTRRRRISRSGRSRSPSRKAAALWFRDLLMQLGVADAEGLATQLTLLVDGSIAQDLVRDDPSMARAAKEAARVLLANAGVKVVQRMRRRNRRAMRSSGPLSSPRKRGSYAVT